MEIVDGGQPRRIATRIGSAGDAAAFETARAAATPAAIACCGDRGTTEAGAARHARVRSIDAGVRRRPHRGDRVAALAARPVSPAAAVTDQGVARLIGDAVREPTLLVLPARRRRCAAPRCADRPPRVVRMTPHAKLGRRRRGRSTRRAPFETQLHADHVIDMTAAPRCRRRASEGCATVEPSCHRGERSSVAAELRRRSGRPQLPELRSLRVKDRRRGLVRARANSLARPERPRSAEEGAPSGVGDVPGRDAALVGLGTSTRRPCDLNAWVDDDADTASACSATLLTSLLAAEHPPDRRRRRAARSPAPPHRPRPVGVRAASSGCRPRRQAGRIDARRARTPALLREHRLARGAGGPLPGSRRSTRVAPSATTTPTCWSPATLQLDVPRPANLAHHDRRRRPARRRLPVGRSAPGAPVLDECQLQPDVACAACGSSIASNGCCQRGTVINAPG